MEEGRYVFVSPDGAEQRSPADVNLENVRQILKKKTNPHPMMIVSLVLVVLAFIYLLYILLGKQLISGDWIGQSGDMTIKRIKHNPFTDNITVYSGGKKIASGCCSGQIVRIDTTGGKLTGMFDQGKIIWIDSGDVWSNIKYLS